MKSTIHIIGVPMDLGQGRRGVDMGPSAIRYAGLHTSLRDLNYRVTDEGDLKIKTQEQQKITNQNARYLPEITRVVRALALKVERTMKKGEFPLVLGGDHSIAIGTISGVASYAHKQHKKIGVLWIDAHGDFNTPDSSPSGNIHGMPLAVCLGLGPKVLTGVGGQFKKVEARNVSIIGLRNVDRTEKEHLLEYGLNLFTMEDIDKHGIHRVIKNAVQKAASGVEYLHVSFDLDSVDPVYAPGVGTPVKGGIDYREAHLIMEMIAASGKMTSLEIVEVNPILDNRNQSAEFAVDVIQSAFGKRIL